MKQTFHSLALAVILLTLTACGFGVMASEAGGAGSRPPALGMCAADAPDCADVVVEPDRGEPASDAPQYRPVPVEGDVAGEGAVISGGELLSAEGSRLDLGFWMGTDECYAVERVDVSETGTKVAVDITVAPRDPGQACIEIAEARSISVELSAPLGGRVLEVGGVATGG